MAHATIISMLIKRDQLADDFESNDSTLAGKKSVPSSELLGSSHVIRGAVQSSDGPIKIGKVRSFVPESVDPISDVDSELVSEIAVPNMPDMPSEYADESDTDPNWRETARLQLKAELEAYRAGQISEAKAERERILKSAYEDGFKKGEQDGKRDLKAAADALKEAISEGIHDRHRLLKETEHELLELSVHIAKKILQQELSSKPDVCRAIVEEALSRVTDKDRVIIKVHPYDMESIRQYRDTLLRLIPDIKNLEIQKDIHIDQGGCLIETKLGYVDSSLSTKLSAIEAALKQAYEDA